jgi:chromosome segregation ATPase
MKGSKIRSLGKQLEQAIRIRLNSLLLAKEKINNSNSDLSNEQKTRILDIAKEKEKTASDLESSLKDKIDTIADGDGRLEKIASIAKTNAAIKPQKEKVKILTDLEYSDNTIEKAKERQKDLINNLKEKSIEFQNEIKELKAKELAKNSQRKEEPKKEEPKKEENSSKIEYANKTINKANTDIDNLQKELKNLETKLANYENPNGINSNKVKKIKYEIKELKLVKLEAKINLAYYNNDNEKKSSLEKERKELEEELNKIKRISKSS